MPGRAAQQVMQLYPKIFFACHTRHVHDPKTRRVISSHQASILDHLDDTESTSLMELAKHMGVTMSTMSITVDRLVRRGYVKRTRDPVDGRRVNLRVSAAGARIKQAKTVLDPDRVEAMLSHLNAEERAQAIHGLALLADAAQQEMHNKILYGLRPRRGKRLKARGGHDAQVDSHRHRSARRADRSDGPDRRTAAKKSRRISKS